MNMRSARRAHPGGMSFRTWVRDVWKKFGEISGDGSAEGKLAAVLGIPASGAKPKAKPQPQAKTKAKAR